MLRTEQNEPLYEVSDFQDYDVINDIWRYFFDKGTVRGKNRTYINDFMTMDIETSTYSRATDGADAIAFTYSIAVYIADKCLIFRKWNEYCNFIDTLNEKLRLTRYFRLVCYVHHLPYEFQFMRDFMRIDEVFATQPRKVVKCFSNGIEYRCSYKLTNMGLARFTASIPNIKHGKLSGDDFDYTKLRTPTTPLSPSELSYIYNDVAGLYEALDYTIKNDEYNIATIPNTSTGFVRNELRYEMGKNPNNRQNFIKTQLDQLTYGLLRTARRGGNTHCNPVYADQEWSDMTSMDMSSAYPAVMVECKFPMSQFLPIATSRLPDFEAYIEAGYACVLDLTFTNICVKDLNSIPYIAKAHCTQFPKKDTDEFVSDNGRVLKASILSMVITDIDYKIIRDTYKWDGVPTCRLCYISKYDYLPNELRKTILRQYKDKTTLKDKDEYMYMKQKNKFNANFGCMLTDICQDEIEYVANSCEPFRPVKNNNFQEQLDRYYSSRNSFLSYQHGVWVTAHCRMRLQKAIQALGYDMVYCDTDSVKFFDTSANRLLFEELNNEIKQDIKDCGLNCTVTYKGKDYTLGLWEPDGDYNRFKSMGAKKYCYYKYTKDHKCIYDKSKECCGKIFEITVAGLSKSKARDYLYLKGDGIHDHDVINLFTKDTIIPKEHSGRTTAKYNDYEKVRVLDIDGEKISVGSNTVIEDTTYKFTLTEDYENTILKSKEGVMW